MTKAVPFENLNLVNAPFEAEFKTAFDQFLKSGWYVLGQEVNKFEAEFAQYLGMDHCVGVASGLDAITLSLLCLDLPKGSEVLVPSNTYIATILSIIQAGHVPVLVEPSLAHYNIDPDQIEGKITSKTKAMVLVHLYGKVCDMGPIMQIARAHGLKVVEDCAQAHGARYRNQLAGTFGDVAAFSFYPTKNLGALGDAGAIVTHDARWAEQLRMLRNYGSKVKYYNEKIGFNSRLDELQATFLRIKLKSLDQINDHKRQLAAYYHQHLSASFIKPLISEDHFDVYHIYNIRTENRDELRAYLAQNGIQTEIHYPVSPNKQVAMAGVLSEVETPLSEEIHRTTLSLPISYCHTLADIQYVCEVLNQWATL